MIETVTLIQERSFLSLVIGFSIMKFGKVWRSLIPVLKIILSMCFLPRRSEELLSIARFTVGWNGQRPPLYCWFVRKILNHASDACGSCFGIPLFSCSPFPPCKFEFWVFVLMPYKNPEGVWRIGVMGLYVCISMCFWSRRKIPSFSSMRLLLC